MTSIVSKAAKLLSYFFGSDLERYREAFESENSSLKFERYHDGKYRDPITEKAWGKWAKQREWDDAQW